MNATAASLLGFLHERPMSGWDLVTTAELLIGDFWSLTRSQVYRELTAMAGAGLIEAGETGPRDRRPYAITDAGRAAFREWLAQPPGDEQIRFPLLLTLVFEAHLPDEQLRAFVTEHRAVHEERLAGYREQHAALGDEASIVLDFGIRYEEAVLGWFDALPARLRGG